MDGVERVLRRKRFGIEVEVFNPERTPDLGIQFSHANYRYYFQVSVLDLVVVIEVMSEDGGLFFHSVYSDTFPVRQIFSVNKMGTTIANKIRNRTIMNVMAE